MLNKYHFSDGGMSLLKHPSAAMAKLIQSAEKSSLKPGVSDKALQKPVMAFVIQRHDLESLQLAMKLALRKAACRVFALQVRLRPCLHVTFFDPLFNNSLLLFSIVPMNSGQNGSITHCVCYSDHHYRHTML